MNFETRFIQLIQQGRVFVLETIKNQQSTFTIALFFLFSGFLCGNLFGTFLNIIREYISWDGLIIILVICLMEIISYFRYQKKKNFINSQIWRTLNYFKIGLMIGFFIDAFKVGS